MTSAPYCSITSTACATESPGTPAVTHVTFDPSKRFHRRYPVDVIRDCLNLAVSDA